MELKEFVKGVLTEIIEGVQDAQSALSKTGAIIAPRYMVYGMPAMITVDESAGERAYVDLVKFKVSVGEVATHGGGVGLGVLFGLVGVKGDAKTGTENNSLTEVKFSIPVRYPVQNVG